jgi:hypothetical protein
MCEPEHFRPCWQNTRVRGPAIRTWPTATAAADPPDEPPGVLLVSQGLSVVPKSALYVCEPAPISGVFVLPAGQETFYVQSSVARNLRHVDV